MARFRRLKVLSTIIEDGIVPVFYHPDPAIAYECAAACHRGGLRTFELTHRGDGAHRVFEEVHARAARDLPGLILGVGSIGDPYTAALYVAAGANFVVGPSLNADVARFCNRRKVPYSPGCGSATEIATAEELGCEIVKLFPGESVGGPDFVRALLGPCPWSSILPTGGVDPTPAGLRAWFEAGIVAAGMGSKLITKEILASRDWSALESRAREIRRLADEARVAK
jgi:2-dehydro-3-deoxyphosphogluconate aldolase/(4S)-4-hydroxy-2-oxoglutarate aldolase